MVGPYVSNPARDNRLPCHMEIGHSGSAAGTVLWPSGPECKFEYSARDFVNLCRVGDITEDVAGCRETIWIWYDIKCCQKNTTDTTLTVTQNQEHNQSISEQATRVVRTCGNDFCCILLFPPMFRVLRRSERPQVRQWPMKLLYLSHSLLNKWFQRSET